MSVVAVPRGARMSVVAVPRGAIPAGNTARPRCRGQSSAGESMFKGAASKCLGLSTSAARCRHLQAGLVHERLQGPAGYSVCSRRRSGVVPARQRSTSTVAASVDSNYDERQENLAECMAAVTTELTTDIVDRTGGWKNWNDVRALLQGIKGGKRSAEDIAALGAGHALLQALLQGVDSAARGEASLDARSLDAVRAMAWQMMALMKEEIEKEIAEGKEGQGQGASWFWDGPHQTAVDVLAGPVMELAAVGDGDELLLAVLEMLRFLEIPADMLQAAVGDVIVGAVARGVAVPDVWAATTGGQLEAVFLSALASRAAGAGASRADPGSEEDGDPPLQPERERAAWVELLGSRLARVLVAEGAAGQQPPNDLAVFAFFATLARASRAHLAAAAGTSGKKKQPPRPELESLLRYLEGASAIYWPDMAGNLGRYQLFLEVSSEELEWLDFFPSRKSDGPKINGRGESLADLKTKQKGDGKGKGKGDKDGAGARLARGAAESAVIEMIDMWLRDWSAHYSWVQEKPGMRSGRFLREARGRLDDAASKMHRAAAESAVAGALGGEGGEGEGFGIGRAIGGLLGGVGGALRGRGGRGDSDGEGDGEGGGVVESLRQQQAEMVVAEELSRRRGKLVGLEKELELVRDELSALDNIIAKLEALERSQAELVLRGRKAGKKGTTGKPPPLPRPLVGELARIKVLRGEVDALEMELKEETILARVEMADAEVAVARWKEQAGERAAGRGRKDAAAAAAEGADKIGKDADALAKGLRATSSALSAAQEAARLAEEADKKRVKNQEEEDAEDAAVAAESKDAEGAGENGTPTSRRWQVELSDLETELISLEEAVRTRGRGGGGDKEIIEFRKRATALAKQLRKIQRDAKEDEDSASLLADPDAAISAFKRASEMLKESGSHLTAGSKLLATDVAAATDMLRRQTLGEALTDRERRKLTRTLNDVLFVVPFGIFLLVPLSPAGHAAGITLMQKFIPDALPSAFRGDRVEVFNRVDAIIASLGASIDEEDEEGGGEGEGGAGKGGGEGWAGEER